MIEKGLIYSRHHCQSILGNLFHMKENTDRADKTQQHSGSNTKRTRKIHTGTSHNVVSMVNRFKCSSPFQQSETTVIKQYKRY